jgi:hypothetical protein
MRAAIASRIGRDIRTLDSSVKSRAVNEGNKTK